MFNQTNQTVGTQVNADDEAEAEQYIDWLRRRRNEIRAQLATANERNAQLADEVLGLRKTLDNVVSAGMMLVTCLEFHRNHPNEPFRSWSQDSALSGSIKVIYDLSSDEADV